MRAQPPVMPDGDPAELLRAIVDSSELVIVTLDLAGVVTSWNRGAERMYGRAADEMVGQNADCLYPQESQELRSILDRITAGLRVEKYDTVRLAHDRQPIDVTVSASPIRDGGTVVGAMVIEWELTERDRLELALRMTEARWRAIVDSAVDGIIVISERGEIEAFNAAAERMFGHSEADVRGRNVSMLMPPPYHEQHDGYLQNYLETGVQKIIGIGREVVGLKSDGTRFPVHLSVGEMRVGSEPRFTGILHDLSARVELEERLREQSSLARLGEMAAVIAHEVRNPLAAVRGAIQVIGGRLPSDGKDAPIVKEIIARLDALNGLLNDLLLFARTPAPRFAPVALSGLLTLTSDFLAKDPAYRDLRIELQGDPPPIIGDAELLKIAFQNLLINGAQAMHGRGTIVVSITTEGGHQRVTITDAGPGVAAEARENLFRPFFTTKSRGTGLGLSITKRLVELHEGTIVVDCPRGGGTVVIVRLPTRSTKA